MCPPPRAGAGLPCPWLLHLLLQGSSPGAFPPWLPRCRARRGLWRPRIVHVFTQTVQTRCVHEVTPNHACYGWKPQSPTTLQASKRRRVLCTPLHRPWLAELELPPPISCPPVRQGAGKSTEGRCQCLRSHRHSSPGSGHRSCLLPGT